MFPLTLEDSVEAREYLRGVLFSDPDFRLDPEVNTDLIDPYGTGNRAFWRGVVEGAGYIGMPRNRTHAYPRFQLNASRPVLYKFIAFIEEENNRRCGVNWKWDADNRITWQADGGYIRLTGQKALEVVLALYMGQSVGRLSCRTIADAITGWVPSR